MLVLRLENTLGPGGDGVDTRAEDGAVVADDAEGTRRPCFAGVEKPETMEPKLSSGADSRDMSPGGLNVLDIVISLYLSSIQQQ